MIRVFLLSIFLCLTLFADRLDEIKQKRLLVVGVKNDFKPFGYIENGKVVGFDIDLVNYIHQKLIEKLRRNIRLKLVQVTSKTRIPLVKANVIDIAAASMTHKQNRDMGIDFTIDYFFDGQSILVRSDSREKSYKDFDGKKVGAVSGASSGMTFFEKNPKADIVYFSTYDQVLKALYDGKVDAVTTDLTWCGARANESNGKLKTIGDTFTYEPYGMGVPENESNFRDEINFALQQAVIDGTYSKLYLKWFGAIPEKLPPVWPK